MVAKTCYNYLLLFQANLISQLSKFTAPLIFGKKMNHKNIWSQSLGIWHWAFVLFSSSLLKKFCLVHYFIIIALYTISQIDVQCMTILYRYIFISSTVTYHWKLFIRLFCGMKSSIFCGMKNRFAVLNKCRLAYFTFYSI